MTTMDPALAITRASSMQPAVTAALIAGAVSLVGAVVSVLSARSSISSGREKLRAKDDLGSYIHPITRAALL